MHAVIRCDAGPDIGGGHVVRCMALGAALVDGGYELSFAVSDATSATVPALPAQFSDVRAGFLGRDADAAALQRCWPAGPDLLVIDHYGLGAAFEAELAGWARRILVIDDAPSRDHVCTHLLDITLGRHAADYRGRVPDSTQLWCGAEFALLREPFRRVRQIQPEKVPPTPGALSVLVSLGMSDHVNATGRALEGLIQTPAVSRVDVAIGATAPHRRELERLVARGGDGYRFHADADAETMASLMAQADLVIGAPGGASYERCCLGRPSLLIVIADNQLDNAAALEKVGAALVLGPLSAVSAGDVASTVGQLAQQPSRLAAMGKAAAEVTDGNGAVRIARMLAH